MMKDLGRTQIKEIPEYFSQLENLQNLCLGSTQIKEIPECISKLENLQTLDLSDTEIKEVPEYISQLENLQNLDLSKTQIKKIPENISRLKTLQTLSFRDTQINEVPKHLIRLKKLKVLNLSNTQINKLPECINQCKNIKALDISNTKVVYFVKSLLSIKMPVLRKDRVDFINNEISSYYYRLSFKENFENGKMWFEPRDFDIKGIYVNKLKLYNFLSKRCLYVLVLDGRKDDNVEYWLKHIKSFGGNSPILVVINKIDMYPGASLNEKNLRDKYKNICGFYKISCKTKENIDSVVDGIKNCLNNVESLKILWNENWINVKNSLEDYGKNYISYDDYVGYCNSNFITDLNMQNNLLNYLNDLGIVCSFNFRNLKERKVLNPRWITVGVYKVVTSNTIKKNNGYFKIKELNNIINEKKDCDSYIEANIDICCNYSEIEQEYILNLMEAFELSHSVDDETILVPSLMNDTEPEHRFSKNCVLEYRFVYSFLSKSVIHRLIVRLKGMVYNDLVWNTGIVLYDKVNNTYALIKLDEEDRTIYINIQGEYGRDLLVSIRKEINEIKVF